MKTVDGEEKSSEGEGLSWPCSLSALFVTMLVSYSLYDGEYSLVDLLYTKGARLIKGEKILLKKVLKTDDKTLSEWNPEVYESAEVEYDEIELMNGQHEAGEGLEDCMEGSSLQMVESRSQILATRDLPDTGDLGYEHGDGNGSSQSDETGCQIQTQCHLFIAETDLVDHGSSRRPREADENWTQDMAGEFSNKRGRHR